MKTKITTHVPDPRLQEALAKLAAILPDESALARVQKHPKAHDYAALALEDETWQEVARG